MKYIATITVAADKELFDAYKSAEDLYRTAQDSVLKAGLDPKAERDEIGQKISDELHPEFAKTQAAAGAPRGLRQD